MPWLLLVLVGLLVLAALGALLGLVWASSGWGLPVRLAVALVLLVIIVALFLWLVAGLGGPLPPWLERGRVL